LYLYVSVLVIIVRLRLFGHLSICAHLCFLFRLYNRYKRIPD